MSSADLMNTLKQQIALNNRALEYAKLVYGVRQQGLYPNSILIDNTVPDSSEGSYYIAPVHKTINNVSTMPHVNEKLLLEQNLSEICSPLDSHTVATDAKLTAEIIKTMNQFFGQFLTSILGVTFKSTDDLVKHIVTFSDKINNNVNIKELPVGAPPINQGVPPRAPPVQPPIQPPINQAPPIPNFPIFNVPPVQQYFLSIKDFISHLNTLATIGEIKRYFDAGFLGVNPASFTRINTKSIYDTVLSKLNDPNEKERLTDLCIKTAQATSGRSTSTPVPNNFMIAEYYAIATIINSYMSVHSGNGFKSTKYGRGLAGKKASDRMEFDHLYVDLGKLNDNVLSIKYTKNGNKKLELAVSDATKMVILQMLLNKFTFSTYDKLTDKEKTVVSFLNNMLTLVPHEQLIPNPIDSLYEKYNILRGEISAGNDNGKLKIDLKAVAFQLHKYKKINSSQLRNLVFELEH